MDYREDFYPGIPFYMTYPAQNMYLAEMEYEKDMDLMKTYYPRETAGLLKLIEKRLDELSYEGSRIYDEEPDHAIIQKEIDGIAAADNKAAAPSYFDMVPMSLADSKLPPGPDRNLAGLLFCAELYRRRCRHRRCRRFWQDTHT